MTIVEVNIVGSTENNLNKLKLLNIDNLIKYPTIKILIKLTSSTICVI